MGFRKVYNRNNAICIYYILYQLLGVKKRKKRSSHYFGLLHTCPPTPTPQFLKSRTAIEIGTLMYESVGRDRHIQRFNARENVKIMCSITYILAEFKK